MVNFVLATSSHYLTWVSGKPVVQVLDDGKVPASDTTCMKYWRKELLGGDVPWLDSALVLGALPDSARPPLFRLLHVATGKYLQWNWSEGFSYWDLSQSIGLTSDVAAAAVFLMPDDARTVVAQTARGEGKEAYARGLADVTGLMMLQWGNPGSGIKNDWFAWWSVLGMSSTPLYLSSPCTLPKGHAGQLYPMRKHGHTVTVNGHEIELTPYACVLELTVPMAPYNVYGFGCGCPGGGSCGAYPIDRFRYPGNAYGYSPCSCDMQYDAVGNTVDKPWYHACTGGVVFGAPASTAEGSSRPFVPLQPSEMVTLLPIDAACTAPVTPPSSGTKTRPKTLAITKNITRYAVYIVAALAGALLLAGIVHTVRLERGASLPAMPASMPTSMPAPLISASASLPAQSGRMPVSARSVASG